MVVLPPHTASLAAVHDRAQCTRVTCTSCAPHMRTIRLSWLLIAKKPPARLPTEGLLMASPAARPRTEFAVAGASHRAPASASAEGQAGSSNRGVALATDPPHAGPSEPGYAADVNRADREGSSCALPILQPKRVASRAEPHGSLLPHPTLGIYTSFTSPIRRYGCSFSFDQSITFGSYIKSLT